MDQNKPPEMTDNERKLLMMEYGQLCQDWRQRDKNVLDKLIAAGILFALLGVALTKTDNVWIQAVLIILGGFFSFICTVSTANDMKYRDGTEQLIRGINKELKIYVPFRNISGLESSIKMQPDDVPFQFLRKVEINPELAKKGEPKYLSDLRGWLTGRRTFRYIFWFYFLATVGCLGTAVVLVLIQLILFLIHLN